MSKENGKPTHKIGEGLKPTGVFKRIAVEDKKSGVADRVRDTQRENLKK